MPSPVSLAFIPRPAVSEMLVIEYPLITLSLLIPTENVIFPPYPADDVTVITYPSTFPLLSSASTQLSIVSSV